MHRQFDSGVLGRLALIALGRAAGFSLEEIALIFRPDGRPRLDRRMLAAKAEELDRTIRELSATACGTPLLAPHRATWNVPPSAVFYRPPCLALLGRAGKRLQFDSERFTRYSEKAGPRGQAEALLWTIDPVKRPRALESTCMCSFHLADMVPATQFRRDHQSGSAGGFCDFWSINIILMPGKLGSCQSVQSDRHIQDFYRLRVGFQGSARRSPTLRRMAS